MELIHFMSAHSKKKKSNIGLAKDGDKEAFLLIINEQLLSMYRVAKGILKEEQDIEDAIQNTIIKAFDKIITLRKDEFFKTWIIRILINECNKIYKYNKGKLKIVETVEKTYTIDPSENIDLYNAINKLSDELRVTTILYYFDDMNQKDIANVLGVKVGTVKSRLFRSKEKLYEMLKGDD